MKVFQHFLDKHQDRILGLDMLRALAILTVVYGHGIYLIPHEHQQIYLKFYPNIDGVSIFFTLSGYLIGGILIKILTQPEVNLKDLINFWIRRWFRTIPNYWFVICGLLFSRWLLNKEIVGFSASYLIFYQNLFWPHPSFFGEAWSLSIEEWFYLLFPVTIFVLLKFIKNRANALFISILLFLIIPLFLRIILDKPELDDLAFDEQFRKIVVFRLDSIMYGVLAVFIKEYRPVWWHRYKLIWLFVGLLIFLLIKENPNNWRQYYRPLQFNIESFVTLLLLPFFSELRTTRFKLLNAAVIFISVISYSMYLLNLTPIQLSLIPLIKEICVKYGIGITQNYTFIYSLFWFFTVFLSYLLYRYFEHPVTQLRDKLKIR